MDTLSEETIDRLATAVADRITRAMKAQPTGPRMITTVRAAELYGRTRAEVWDAADNGEVLCEKLPVRNGRARYLINAADAERMWGGK